MHKKQRRRLKRAGMTLIEIMIVVVIMAMIAGAAGLAAMDRMKEARIKNTQAEVRTLASGAEAFMIENPTATCPSAQTLIDERFLRRGSSTADAWGAEYVISCEGDVNVQSPGPDGQTGTEDDIRVF